MNYFIYKVLVPCAECGESLSPRGPELMLDCSACGERLELSAERWRALLSFRQYAAEFALRDGTTRGSSLTDGELRVFVRWGPALPRCAACQAHLAVGALPPGADGQLRCACGAMSSTFPAPAWLRAVVPSAIQVFGAEREGSAAGAAGAAVAVSSAASRLGRPVQFACPVCGGNLAVTQESPRILSSHAGLGELLPRLFATSPQQANQEE